MILCEVRFRATCRCVQRCTPRQSPPIWFEHGSLGVPKMKAIVIDDYGGVDQLHLRELPDPRPQADEVLVRVRAAGVNPVDWKHRPLIFIEDASLPIAGCTAVQALRDLGKLSKGTNALILGAAGGVGHFAVQIAKALGAKTSATCGPSNIAFVQSLGADHVIDYSGKDFMAGLDRFDVIFDAVGKSSFASCQPHLAPGGTYVTTLPTPSLFFLSGVQSIAGIFRSSKRAKGILVRPSGKDLAYVCQLA